MTMLQMAGMYQAIANNGLRDPAADRRVARSARTARAP